MCVLCAATRVEEEDVVVDWNWRVTFSYFQSTSGGGNSRRHSMCVCVEPHRIYTHTHTHGWRIAYTLAHRHYNCYILVGVI